jgi:hypothetical protein
MPMKAWRLFARKYRVAINSSNLIGRSLALLGISAAG